MAVKVGEFFINLAVDAASGNLSVNELISALGKLDVVSVGTVGVLSKITSTLVQMGQQATATAVEMSVLQDITGVNPKTVQQWENAARRINIQAGSIVNAVRGVNDMMGSIAARKASPPAELTGWLGITPQKGLDAQGRPVMKTFFDLITEIANPKNRYWSFTDQVKQQLLGGAFPGADSKDIFRVLNEMRAGRFRPQDISVLENKQVKELTDVNRKQTEIGQQMVGIFDKLILGGSALATVLDAVSAKLEVLDKWLASKQGNQVLSAVGASGGSLIRNLGNPFAIGREFGEFAGEKLFGAAPKQTPAVIKMDDWNGRLNINIAGQGGQSLGNKTIFLGKKVTNSDVEQVTINAGNGGLGQ